MDPVHDSLCIWARYTDALRNSALRSSNPLLEPQTEDSLQCQARADIRPQHECRFHPWSQFAVTCLRPRLGPFVLEYYGVLGLPGHYKTG